MRLSLFLGGEADFIEKLFSLYSREVYVICYSYCHSKANAEDCLQEVFYRALSKASRLKKHSAPEKWLFTTARLVSLENLRADKKALRHEAPLEGLENALQSESFEDKLLEQTYTDSDLVLLRAGIWESLGEREKELYILRYIEKREIADIAKCLDISYSNVTTRINRLKTKILKAVSRRFL